MYRLILLQDWSLFSWRHVTNTDFARYFAESEITNSPFVNYIVFPKSLYVLFPSRVSRDRRVPHGGGESMEDAFRRRMGAGSCGERLQEPGLQLRDTIRWVVVMTWNGEVTFHMALRGWGANAAPSFMLNIEVIQDTYLSIRHVLHCILFSEFLDYGSADHSKTSVSHDIRMSIVLGEMFRGVTEWILYLL